MKTNKCTGKNCTQTSTEHDDSERLSRASGESRHTPTPLRVTIVHRLNGYPNYICPNDKDHENHGTFLSVSFTGSNVKENEQEEFLERVTRAVNDYETVLQAGIEAAKDAARLREINAALLSHLKKLRDFVRHEHDGYCPLCDTITQAEKE